MLEWSQPHHEGGSLPLPAPHTTVDCPAVVAPGRNASCHVAVRGAFAGALGGNATVLPYLNATLRNGGAWLPVW